MVFVLRYLRQLSIRSRQSLFQFVNKSTSLKSSYIWVTGCVWSVLMDLWFKGIHVLPPVYDNCGEVSNDKTISIDVISQISSLTRCFKKYKCLSIHAKCCPDKNFFQRNITMVEEYFEKFKSFGSSSKCTEIFHSYFMLFQSKNKSLPNFRLQGKKLQEKLEKVFLNLIKLLLTQIIRAISITWNEK